MISEVVFSFDVDQVVMDLVHHHQAAVESTILERWPFEDVHHICYATGAVVISHNESSSTALDLFDLLNISLSVGVPSCSSKFNSWPNISVVSCFLHLLAAVAKIPREEGFGTMGFPGDSINMGVKVELVVQMNAEVFSRLHHFQDLAMDGIGCWEDVPLLGDLEDLTF